VLGHLIRIPTGKRGGQSCGEWGDSLGRWRVVIDRSHFSDRQSAYPIELIWWTLYLYGVYVPLDLIGIQAPARRDRQLGPRSEGTKDTALSDGGTTYGDFAALFRRRCNDLSFAK
jgi:hypothetical protein